MALPSISTPEFSTKIPSTGQDIKYRPFLVKEEKILLMALEGGDQNEITDSILKILKVCILSEVDVDKLSTFDVEYLFLKLRAKSVGEIVDLKLGHDEGECTHLTEVSLNIDDVNIVGEISDGKIQITDEVGVKMRYPTVVDIADMDTSSSDETFELVARCVEFIYDNEEVYTNFTKQEIIDWVGNLNQSQFKSITSFFESIPKLSKEIKWTCPACAKEESRVIEGLQGFFTLR